MSDQDKIYKEIRAMRIDDEIRELKRELKTTTSYDVMSDIEKSIKKLENEKAQIYDPWYEPDRHGR